MSWRRERRCSYCRNTGHDIRACDVKLRRLKSCFDTAQSAQDTWSIKYYAEEISKISGVNPITGQKVVTKRVARCTYCKWKHGDDCKEGIGHNRTKCIFLKRDKEEAKRLNAEYRKTIAEHLTRFGINEGALLSKSGFGWFHKTPEGDIVKPSKGQKTDWHWHPGLLYYIAGFKLDNINYWSSDAKSIKCIAVGSSDNRTAMFSLPTVLDSEGEVIAFDKHEKSWTRLPVKRSGSWSPIVGDLSHSHKRSSNYITLLSPTSGIEFDAPAWWLEGGGMALEIMFDDRRS